jgi:hypothetical protein
MDQVFRGSIVTLFATAGDNADAGLSITRDPRWVKRVSVVGTSSSIACSKSTFWQSPKNHRPRRSMVPLVMILLQHLIPNLLHDAKQAVVAVQIASREFMRRLDVTRTRTACELVPI